jgi:hypothetical protein
MASQGSLMQKVLDVQLLPLSPTAKYHSASKKLLGSANLEFCTQTAIAIVHITHVPLKLNDK